MTFEEWWDSPEGCTATPDTYKGWEQSCHFAWNAGAASRDAEIAELKADAERYRWLCEHNKYGNGFFHPAFAARNIMSWKTKAEIDDGIDRARGDTK